MYFVHTWKVKRDGRELEEFCVSTVDAAGPYACEYLRAGVETKVYLDADDYVELTGSIEEDSGRLADALTLFEGEVISRAQKILTVLQVINPEASMNFARRQRPLKSASFTYKYKLSMRVYYSGVRISYVDIKRFLSTGPFEGVFCGDDLFDKTVYKPTDQLLGMVGCKKSAEDPSVLRPLPGSSQDATDYIVQAVDPEWPLVPSELIDELQDVDVEPASPATSATTTTTQHQRPDLEETLGLLKCMKPRTAGDRSKWLQKFKSPKDCRELWDSLETEAKESSAKRLLTLGTLCMYAKEDDPEAYQRWRQEVRLRASRDSGDIRKIPVDDRVRGIAASILHTMTMTSQEVMVTDASFNAASRTMTMTCSNDYEMRLDVEKLFVELRFKNKNGQDVDMKRYLHADEASAIEVSALKLINLHRGISVKQDWHVMRPDDAEVAFHPKDKNTHVSIKLYNVDSPGHESARVEHGHQVTTLKPKDLKALVQTYHGALNDIRTRLNLHTLNVMGDLNVNFNIISNSGQGKLDDAPRKNDEELACMALPLCQNMRFSPDSKSSNCNGIYICDLETNVWRQCHNVAIEQRVVDFFKSSLDGTELTAQDLKHVLSRRGRADMVHILAGKCLEEGFSDKLDANLDIFAVDNGCFDCSGSAVGRRAGDVFRAITATDYVKTTAGWSYSKTAALEHRADVEAFLAKVLPVPEERRVVLAYVAQLLSGKRTVKKFLAFTDRRAGNNGKSTLLQLLGQFFGAYTEINTKFVCRGSFDRDRDSHDAGLESLRGKRFLVAEELKHNMALDEALLKRLTGGAGVQITGRRCGSSERFTFEWQAGIALVFNEGDCPKFDAGDTAFMNRMIVVPMRAKFVPADVLEASKDFSGLHEEFTFAADPGINNRFSLWCSALADILVEHYTGTQHSLFEMLPRDMASWRQSVSGASNPYAGLLEETVRVTADHKDSFLIADLKERLNITDRTFSKMAEAYFSMVQGVKVQRSSTHRGLVKGALIV